MNNRRQEDRRAADVFDRTSLACELEKANARIAELELDVYELEGCCHLVRRELNQSTDLVYFSVMRINEALDRVLPPADKGE